MTAADVLRRLICEADGILQLDPAFVARDWLPPGRRLGLPPDAYDAGERGFICERWLGSTTHADNAIGPEDEGLSYVRFRTGDRALLGDVVAAAPAAVLGADYASTHEGLGRLAKIFDFGARIPFHIHPPTEFATRVGRRSKDEAYYFPAGVDRGAHPESFLGLHPGSSRETDGPALLEELRRWDSDTVLGTSQAYLQLPDDGFFIPSGVLHAPGTALTLELQEDSDTLAMFQALNAGTVISKELLFKDVSAEDRAAHGEVALLDWIDWPVNTHPEFYLRHHTAPIAFVDSDAATESWIFYGSPKFSGKRLTVRPGQSYSATENGVFSLFVWQGRGSIGGVPVRGGSLTDDELLIVDDRARRPLDYVNDGTEDLVVIKVFGPDVNLDAPQIGALDTLP
jgi:hypothetical protein